MAIYVVLCWGMHRLAIERWGAQAHLRRSFLDSPAQGFEQWRLSIVRRRLDKRLVGKTRMRIFGEPRSQPWL